jgi:NhaP-type Na+/H+ or K+/H+ antiporter
LTTDEILTGVALIVVLAVGSQVLASRLHIPALIVLLPAGFIAGALTDDVNPIRLLGPAFQPLVSLSVALILYDAGLGLDLRKLTGHTRRVVVRLIAVGVPLTWLVLALVGAPLLGMSGGAALELGAILVVSGPTVVGPLLAFVRPVERLQRVLAWEGSLVDPVGGILGAVVFHGVLAGTQKQLGSQFVLFLGSVGVGLAGAVAGTAVLWLLLRGLRLGEVLGTSAQLAVVVGVAAGCDIFHDDAGLIAAIVMGVAVANIRTFDIPARRPFFETLVQLVIGLLFVSISATITPSSLRHLVLPTLGLVALLVLVVRPVVAALATLRTDLSCGERMFTGWMAPRGIVAAATATTFSATLAAHGIGGAAKILPVTFLVIVATVAIYGLSAAPIARLVGVLNPPRTRPLLVGGKPWVVELGCALRSAGLDVLMWAGQEQERSQITEAHLELAPGELLASAAGSGAQLEGVTAVLLLTEEDDFNALASTVIGAGAETRVYRLGPPARSHGVVAPFTGSDILFGEHLTRTSLAARHAAGSQIIARLADGAIPEGADMLFLVHADGQLEPVTRDVRPAPQPGETVVLLGPAA